MSPASPKVNNIGESINGGVHKVAFTSSLLAVINSDQALANCLGSEGLWFPPRHLGFSSIFQCCRVHAHLPGAQTPSPSPPA